jgi:hypothetical protein
MVSSKGSASMEFSSSFQWDQAFFIHPCAGVIPAGSGQVS